MTQYANRGINDKIDHVDALRLASLLLLLRVERALFCGLPRSAAMSTMALANVAGLRGRLNRQYRRAYPCHSVMTSPQYEQTAVW